MLDFASLLRDPKRLRSFLAKIDVKKCGHDPLDPKVAPCACVRRIRDHGVPMKLWAALLRHAYDRHYREPTRKPRRMEVLSIADRVSALAERRSAGQELWNENDVWADEGKVCMPVMRGRNGQVAQVGQAVSEIEQRRLIYETVARAKEEKRRLKRAKHAQARPARNDAGRGPRLRPEDQRPRRGPRRALTGAA